MNQDGTLDRRERIEELRNLFGEKLADPRDDPLRYIELMMERIALLEAIVLGEPPGVKQ